MIAKTGNPRFVWDAYRRLIMMYADVVMEKAAGIEPAEGQGIRQQLDRMLDELKESKGYATDADIPAEDLEALTGRFKDTVKQVLGKDFPDDPMEQLWGGIGAVFSSWNGKRAVAYRRIEGIPDEWGTAVNVQAMVFGNMGDTSATGVAFTRNPATGDNKFYGEWLVNAQGEDVVAGTPSSRSTTRTCRTSSSPSRRASSGCSRPGPASAPGAAAVKIACDMVKEKLITEQEAMLRIPAGRPDQLLLPVLRPDGRRSRSRRVLAKGLPASPGAAVGQARVHRRRGRGAGHAGEQVILVRKETSPEDVGGMHAAVGILTEHRRHDQPRGGRRAGLGQVLHRGAAT
jgi:pyruvate,orthophosphate dikinase